MTKDNTTACCNNICIKNKECERYRLFKSGVNAKANSGNEKNGCLKFLPIEEKMANSLEVKYNIGEEVTVMFDSNKDYSYCEHCNQQIEPIENKVKTICEIKDIRIEKHGVKYGIYKLDKRYPDTTYLFSEESIDKC